MKQAVKFSVVILALSLLSTGLYANNHHLDTTFSGTGYVTTDFPPDTGSTQDEAWAITTSHDGKIVVVGYSENDIAAARYNVDGSLDTSFGGTGTVTTNVAAPDGYGNYYEIAYAAAVQADQKIVAVGRTSASAFVVRYNVNGKLDTTFNGNGRVIVPTSLNNDTLSEARAVTVQPDGKIVFTGYGRLSQNENGILLARLNPDGSYDSSFDSDGKTVTPFPVAFTNLEVSAVHRQPDGKIITAGTVWVSSSDTYFFAARYLPNGQVDTGFGQNGFWIAETFGHASDVELDPQGRIVIGGVGYGAALIARLNPNGSLDTGFGTNGFASTPHSVGTIGSIALDPAGRIVFGSQYSDESVGAIAQRFTSDGQPDTTFGDQGLVITQFNTYLDINDVTVDTAGRVMAAGFIQQEDTNNTRFLVMRYANAGLQNGDFESGAFAPWERTGSKLVCKANCAVKLNPKGSLIQQVGGSAFETGDTLSLDVWVKGRSAVRGGSVKLVVLYQDGQREKVARKFKTGSYPYTLFQTAALTLTKPVQHVTVRIDYTGSQGSLLIDNVNLGVYTLAFSDIPLPPSN